MKELSGTRRPPFDRYTIAGVALFLFTVLSCWKSYVIGHEMIYLLGPRRVADPSFLAADFTWSVLSPTSFLFDHLVAPLWSLCGEFATVNAGRFLSWALSAWAISLVARALRLPAWSVVAGFAIWLCWGQSLADCGSPFEGFQVKSFSYPLLFLSLAFALRRQAVRAGLAAGLATAFHVIVGGWGLFAILPTLLLPPRQFSLRRLGAFVLASAPFVLPVVLAVALFHEAGASREEREWMDEIYVTVAAPLCCNVDYFMTPLKRWVRAGVIFVCAPLVVYGWSRRDEVRILGGFVVAIEAFFLLGWVGQRLELYSFLKLFPCQLGSSLPALFLFVFLLAWIGKGIPRSGWGRAVGALVLAGTTWIVYDRDVVQAFAAMPREVLEEVRRPTWGRHPAEEEYGNEDLYRFIRTATPRDAVFVTPLLKDFWPYAERAQVASRRHPPFDRRLIEWTERLEATNELDLEGDLGDKSERDLSIDDLLEIRRLYGATHYLTEGERVDLAGHRLATIAGYSVYDLRGLDAAGHHFTGR